MARKHGGALLISDITELPDIEIENAYIYFYIIMEDNLYFKENNEMIKIINELSFELMKDELRIRDINVSKLVDRANAIIHINRNVQ